LFIVLGRGEARVFRVEVTGKAAPFESRRTESGGEVLEEVQLLAN